MGKLSPEGVWGLRRRSRTNTAVQISGCRECSSLGLVPEDSRGSSCVWCDQVNDLLSLVAELKEEVKRIKNFRECERGRRCERWSGTLPPLRPRQQEAAPQEAEDPLPSCYQAERGEGGNGNGSLLGAAGESPPGLPHLPSCR